MDETQPPQPGWSPMGGQNPNFNQWFLDNREGVETLRNLWRGYERDDRGNWVRTANSEKNRIMNEKGIHWATQLLESYLIKVYQYTNWDANQMNYELCNAGISIWVGLTYQYREFLLSKVNVLSVGNAMLSVIHGNFLASRGGGIRDYLGSTQNIQEIRQSNPDENRKGFFNSIRGMIGGQ